MKKMILSVILVLATGAAASACDRASLRSRSVTRSKSNAVVTVQTPAPVAKLVPKPVEKRVENKAAAPVAAPVVLTSGCESGRCRTVTSSRLRLFR